MSKTSLTLFQRLTAWVTLLALAFTSLPAHATLLQVRGKIIFPNCNATGNRTCESTIAKRMVRREVIVSDNSLERLNEQLYAEGGTFNRGRYCDEAHREVLGLYYLRARLMNPLTGRFWNADSYEGENEDPVSLHKYLYSNASPISGRDPSGRYTLVETQSVAATIASVTSNFASVGLRAYRIYSQAQDVLNFFYGVSDIVTQLTYLEEGLSSTELADMFWDAAWEILIEDAPQMVIDAIYPTGGILDSLPGEWIRAGKGIKTPKWGAKHVGDRHWRWIQKIADKLKAKEFTNIRVNRAQPGYKNRPDIQAVNPDGKRRWYIEVDNRPGSSRRHAEVIKQNDPRGNFNGLILRKDSKGNSKQLEQIVESWFIK